MDNSSITSHKKTKVYIKRGSPKENELDLLFSLTKTKLKQDYINKLSQLLYDCKSIKNYSVKRMNLDKTVYKYDKNNELYITLQNFNFKKDNSITYNNSKNNKNYSYAQKSSENASKFFTNDTIANNSYNIPVIQDKHINHSNKKKLNTLS